VRITSDRLGFACDNVH